MHKSPAPLTIRFRVRVALGIFAFLLLSVEGSAQVADSLSEPSPKNARQDTLVSTHSVRKATVLSALLPGAGQVYNRKAWKVPILYAGFAGLGYLIHFNQKRYTEYENALLIRYDDDPETQDAYVDLYTDDNLRTLSDYYRRNRDLSFVGITLLYVLNIIDAHVDAHLFNFNMNDDLSMAWQPLIPIHSGNGSFSPGIQLTLQF